MTEQHNPVGSDRLLPPEDASALLGVSPRTLLRYVEQGRIPAQRTPGGHRRYRASDVERLRLLGASPAPPVVADAG